MKYSILFLAGLTRLAAAVSCAGNNCNRAVTGTAFGTAVLSSHLADCSSFFTVQVTPATTTTTITTWITTPTPKILKLARSANVPVTFTPTAIPSYATAACDGNATPVPVRYSSACSCAGVTAGTTTLPTPTATVLINLADCTDTGLQFAAYGFISHSNYNPAIYKSQTPEVSGVTETYTYNTDGSPAGPESVYGSTPIPVDLIALDHRGFFIADQSGTYTITVNSVDDWLTMWIGPYAFSGWSLNNALFTVQWPGGENTYNINLNLGIYPIRFMWVNGGGPGEFGFTITAPDGSTVESPNISDSPYFVTDCAIANTPTYPPFGSEE